VKFDYLEILDDTRERLKSIVSVENRDIINRHKFEADERSQDIKLAILRTHLGFDGYLIDHLFFKCEDL
jgi:hypothetical protein